MGLEGLLGGEDRKEEGGGGKEDVQAGDVPSLPTGQNAGDHPVEEEEPMEEE